MMQYMLDTNICIYIIKKQPANVFQKFESLTVGQVCISAIAFSELQFGISNSSAPEHNQSVLNEFLGPIEILEYPSIAAPVYGQIRASLKKKGCMIGANDMLISAHALSQSITLVTNNTKEFQRVDGLKVENWV